MSDSTYVVGLSIPAGNGVATYSVFKTPLGDSNVEEIQISFPPGCNGLVGAKIYAGGASAYPNDPLNYFVFDDYVYIQQVSNQINSGDWSIGLFNTDYVPHIIRVIYKFNYLTSSPGGFTTGAISLGGA